MTVNFEDKYYTGNLSPEEAEAVEWLEEHSWVVSLGNRGYPKMGEPPIFNAEHRHSLPVRRQNAHSLPSLKIAVERDLQRRGEVLDKVPVTTGVVSTSSIPTQGAIK